ncbi:transposase [Kribbella sp. NBC_00359]|uniref:transposase n=1 Tax=Kribbella sp. NBC_00359 TaxID=2975966 RepID=UPI003FA5D3CD
MHPGSRQREPCGAPRARNRLAHGLVERCRLLTVEILQLDKELDQLVAEQAPSLLDICGCATLSAAKIIGETANVRRFRSCDTYACHNGTAPLSVWSGNRERSTGNRQIHAAIHRIAITQAHYHPDAIAYLKRRREAGDTKAESFRALKRRLLDVVYRALLADAEPPHTDLTHQAA